jgi:hypothetical protein
LKIASLRAAPLDESGTDANSQKEDSESVGASCVEAEVATIEKDGKLVSKL